MSSLNSTFTGSEYTIEQHHHPSNKFIKRKFLIDEGVIQYFTCALAKTILLQGFIYLTEKHLCFYSKWNDKTLFGKSTRIKIPYTEIRSLVKDTGVLALPNSIKLTQGIHQANGAILEREHDFTSFLWRDDCFALIQQLTNHSKKLA